MGARILVIEDNPDNMELMSYLLGAFGHHVVRAGDGPAGLDAARLAPPDVVICDLQLPGIDGFEVARRFRQVPLLRGVHIVAVTAYAMVGDRDRILAAGFDGYISKPIEPTRFVGEIEAFLPGALRSGDRPDLGHVEPPSREPLFADPSPPAPTGARSVLVVDDLLENVDLVRAILEPHGFEVSSATGGRDAFDLARRTRPGLILSDIHMARGSGFDLLRAIRADPCLAEVPFVLVTATGPQERNRAEAERAGADGFLTRPLEPETLLAEVRRHVEPRGR